MELPQMREETWRAARKSYKATPGGRCDGFHPKVQLDRSEKTRSEVGEFLQQCGKWPQSPGMTMIS